MPKATSRRSGYPAATHRGTTSPVKERAATTEREIGAAAHRSRNPGRSERWHLLHRLLDDHIKDALEKQGMTVPEFMSEKDHENETVLVRFPLHTKRGLFRVTVVADTTPTSDP